jgi:hypothetical protein
MLCSNAVRNGWKIRNEQNGKFSHRSCVQNQLLDTKTKLGFRGRKIKTGEGTPRLGGYAYMVASDRSLLWDCFIFLSKYQFIETSVNLF